MPKGKTTTGKRKQSNIPDFKKFVKENINLGQKQIYEKYLKESKYGIKKQTALEIIRTEYGIEKGEKRGKSVQEKQNTSKAKEYIQTPRKKQTPRYTGKGKEKGSNNYITFDKKHGFSFLDRKSEMVRKLRDKIQNTLGTEKEQFIQIDITIEEDGYTQNNTFSVWIPFNGRNKQGVKSIGQKIIGNLKIYYSKLAGRYSTDNRGNMSSDILETLEILRKDLNRAKNVDHDTLVEIFADKGINLETFELISFTNNSQ